MPGLRCRERAGGKRDGELMVGEEEERKEAIVDDKCRGMSGWCMKWRKDYLKSLWKLSFIMQSD